VPVHRPLGANRHAGDLTQGCRGRNWFLGDVCMSYIYRLLSPGKHAKGTDNRHSNPDHSSEPHFPLRRFNFGPRSSAPNSVKSLFEPCDLVRPDRTRETENQHDEGQFRFHIGSHMGGMIVFVEQRHRPAADVAHPSRDDVVMDERNRCVEPGTDRRENS